ncbi:MAG TPA: TonB-dependent receptor [Bryobacteraceae bacterium]|jgi:hypothetical protein|nr:TonB-dependent receptor [Bryobacteraceae bacterium]
MKPRTLIFLNCIVIWVASGSVAVAQIMQATGLPEKKESITVVADVQDSNIFFPDPAQRVFVRQELLDANPGRPGAPISIPGLPIETASGGIKAPQYFSPGVAGDHGEPIAQYIQIGDYLLSNNLSSNAHGNGYADPNILVPAILEGVQTDGGAFNVREGNHAEDLAAIYQLRSRLEPFVTITGDYRDIDITAGWSPGNPETDAWIAVEAAYGNGFLDRLEHRQQYKWNGFRIWNLGAHQLTLFGIGYYGVSYVPGLVPLDVPDLHDTIDPRQKDQTHTGEIAVNDIWKLDPKQQLQFSGTFRTYNLSLLSNFGDGLIRQSEFRTVAGGNGIYLNNLSRHVTLLAGVDYQRDAPRRLDLDHYESTDPSYYGPFQKVTANNVTLGDTAPYIALTGALPGELHYYAGWRRDEIQFDNEELLNPLKSHSAWVGFNSPKATISFLPVTHPVLPSLSFSFGEAFYTNDPRVGTGTEQGTPISREHSYQLVVSKTIAKTDFRVTLGHVTTEASLAKIDADTGLHEDEGPGRNKFITIAARRYFDWGLLQASVSKADARDLDSGLPTPEAPRLIVDVLGTVNRLPFGLQARAEFEEIGAKPLGDGFRSVPVREFRGALVRSFLQHRMEAGINFLIASGYTGQTTELLAVDGQGAPFEQVVGVRVPSYVSASYTCNFGARRAQ